MLDDIGASQVPQIWVYNKCDLLEESQRSREPSDWTEVHTGVRRQRVFVSAATGAGLPELRQAIAEHALTRLNGVHQPPIDERFAAIEAAPSGTGPATVTTPH